MAGETNNLLNSDELTSRRPSSKLENTKQTFYENHIKKDVYHHTSNRQASTLIHVGNTSEVRAIDKM